jgi:uncharacterized protein YlbG (UPF0298 family)
VNALYQRNQQRRDMNRDDQIRIIKKVLRDAVRECEQEYEEKQHAIKEREIQEGD